MTRQWILSALLAMTLGSVAVALDAADVAFVAPAKGEKKAAKKNKKKNKNKKATPDSSTPDVLWIRLENYQIRATRRKGKVQRKLERRKDEHQRQLSPIELSKTQKLAIRKALKIKKALPRKVMLYIDFQAEATKYNGKDGVFITRPIDQFKGKNPSDPKPN